MKQNRLAGARPLLMGGAWSVLIVTVLSVVAGATGVAAGDEVEYTFGRPVQDGEHTYAWYRKTHADEAAQRYGADPKKVGDGMDTWHWWCGVDNPLFWRHQAILTAKNYSVTGVHQDFLR